MRTAQPPGRATDLAHRQSDLRSSSRSRSGGATGLVGVMEDGENVTARLYPEEPEFEAASERAVVEVLRDQLPDDAVLFVNQRFTDGGGRPAPRARRSTR
jgi:hypothetical protein